MSLARESLDHFNRSVLACQDEAFTLAYYLLGEENTACALLQDVIRTVYAGWRGEVDVGYLVLRGVVLLARQVVTPSWAFDGTRQIPGWEELKRCEQEILLLVDVLGKSYSEAARIVERSQRDVTISILNGRQKLLFHSKIKSEAPFNSLKG